MPSFAELAAAFLAEEYADSPVRASHLGVDGYDDRLDDLSEAAFAARRRRSAEWLARFEAVPDDGLSNNSHATIPDTAVHEAYPGHHWHLVTMKRHPSAVRRTFRTPYFSEGWALYAEQLMREQGFFRDPRQEMSQVEAALFRAARIVVDTSLHLGEMGFDEAVAFMRAKANLPEPTARAEVARYCSWPTRAAAYLTGCLEILALRERYVERRGRSDVATLRVFHDTLAGSGGLPIALAERALFG